MLVQEVPTLPHLVPIQQSAEPQVLNGFRLLCLESLHPYFVILVHMFV